MTARTLLSTLVGLTLWSPLHANEDSLRLIPLPLYAPQDRIIVSKVPMVVGSAIPESLIALINSPYVPPTNSVHKQGDLNALTKAGVSIEAKRLAFRKFRVTIHFKAKGDKVLRRDLLFPLLQCVHSVVNGGTVEVKLSGIGKDSELHAVLARAQENLARKRGTEGKPSDKQNPR